MTDLTIGPFAFPLALLVTFGALVLGTAVGNRVAAAQGINAERSLWLVIATAVLAARAAFVALYWSHYADNPLRLLDIRDGGFMALPGVVAALLAGAWLAWRRRGERKAVLAGVLAGCLAFGAGTALVSLQVTEQRLPQLALADLDGRTVSLDALAGRPVVINLWASWCPPCRREMPALGQAQRDAPDVTFVFANQGEPPETIRAYLAAEGLALKGVLLDPERKLAGLTGSPALPTTLFFDASGKLVDRRLGELSSATLAQRLELLRQPAGIAKK